ncbi:MAG: thiamine diphosphokinase [Acidimicrobiales bacterium]|nr:thiamine diphosphokinase [Acidimicrobiales bacterium]
MRDQHNEKLEQSLTLVAIGGDPDGLFCVPPMDRESSVVIAADSGLDRLEAAGIVADHLVGDLDSVTERALRSAQEAGTRVHRFEADKDASDFELALDLAIALIDSGAPDRLFVLGPGGGRLDLVLSDALTLASERLGHLNVQACIGGTTISVVRPGKPAMLTMTADTIGEQVSLLAVGVPARGIHTSALRWPLIDGQLAPGSSRGLSNELIGATATVSISEGVLVVIQPGTYAAPIAPRSSPYDPSPKLTNHPLEISTPRSKETNHDC